MNRKIIIAAVAIIIVGIGGWFLKTRSDNNLVSPNLTNETLTTSPSPTPNNLPKPPQSFKFDSSTDLKAELEKINPQVLDSDFE